MDAEAVSDTGPCDTAAVPGPCHGHLPPAPFPSTRSRPLPPAPLPSQGSVISLPPVNQLLGCCGLGFVIVVFSVHSPVLPPPTGACERHMWTEHFTFWLQFRSAQGALNRVAISGDAPQGCSLRPWAGTGIA